MTTDINNPNHLTAADGKVLRRIADGWISGREIYLGNTYYLGDELLDTPFLELPEHYEEIDEPATEDMVILDEETEIVEVVSIAERIEVLPEKPVPEPRKVTLADYRALEQKVVLMMQALGIH